MAQSDGRVRSIVGRDPELDSLVRLWDDLASPEVMALLLLALSLFSVVALGNAAGLW
ncbi:hypothetical protein [Natrinema sp. 74]|uniref:hypothetical protein n=1 Tax=Natrinema sp. 74 TaxID=3384159 RepID=UPI0038D42392